MLITKGDKRIEIPNWVVYAGILVIGDIVSDLCAVVKESKK